MEGQIGWGEKPGGKVASEVHLHYWGQRSVDLPELLQVVPKKMDLEFEGIYEAAAAAGPVDLNEIIQYTRDRQVGQRYRSNRPGGVTRDHWNQFDNSADPSTLRDGHRKFNIEPKRYRIIKDVSPEDCTNITTLVERLF
jgi:hypothetical protein